MDSYCISPEYDWTRNSVDEGPCVVARRLMNLCNPVPRYYPLRRLDEGTVNEHYPSPSQQQATPCMCSMPVYNLLQLCVACQHNSPSTTTSWDDYAINCEAVFVPGFPLSIPDDCRVPDWAWTDNSRGATNVALAFHQAVTNSTNLHASLTPSTTTTITLLSSPTTQSAASAAWTDPSQAQQNHMPLLETPLGKGIIVAGVLVAVLGAGIVAFAIAFFGRKRRTRRQGQRLGSSTDLPIDKDGDGEMVEKGRGPGSTGDHVSVSLPSESFLSSRASRTSSFTTDSYTTNSVSSQSEYLERPTSYGGTERSYFASTWTDSASENGFSLSDSLDDTSPFADVHRVTSSSSTTTSSSRTTTTASSLNVPMRAHFTTRLLPRTHNSTYTTSSSSSTEAGDALSLSSSRSPAPSTLSSTGATWGREHDGDSVLSAGSQHSF